MEISNKTGNICNKNPAYEKTWAAFNKFFAEEYHGIRKLQHINATQVGFCGTNMAITIQDEIY